MVESNSLKFAAKAVGNHGSFTRHFTITKKCQGASRKREINRSRKLFHKSAAKTFIDVLARGKKFWSLEGRVEFSSGKSGLQTVCSSSIKKTFWLAMIGDKKKVYRALKLLAGVTGLVNYFGGLLRIICQPCRCIKKNNYFLKFRKKDTLTKYFNPKRHFLKKKSLSLLHWKFSAPFTLNRGASLRTIALEPQLGRKKLPLIVDGVNFLAHSRTAYKKFRGGLKLRFFTKSFIENFANNIKQWNIFAALHQMYNKILKI